MDKPKKKDKTITITLNKLFYLKVGIIMLLCIGVLGTTYAWFKNNKASNKVNRIIAGSISLSIDDEADSGIDINNALPETDKAGLSRDAYSFTLTNTGSSIMAYNIKLVDKSINEGKERLSDSSIKISFKKDDEADKLSLLNTYALKTVNNETYRSLDSGLLQAGQTHNYSFNLWINEAAGNEVIDKEFSAYVKVDGTQYIHKDIDDYITVTADGVLSFGGKYRFDQYFTVDGIDGYIPQDIVIPSTWNGYTVKTIGVYRYSTSCLYPYVTGITIPYTAENIAQSLFLFCSNLTTLKFENTVNKKARIKEIPYNAFASTSIESVTLPSSIETLGLRALFSSKMKMIIFEDSLDNPSHLTSFYSQIISSVSNVSELKIPHSLTTFTGLILPPTLTKFEFNGAKDGTSKLTTISGALSAQNLTEITIPASVTSISSNAFTGCASLTNIYIMTNDLDNPQTINFGSNWKNSKANVTYKLIEK